MTPIKPLRESSYQPQNPPQEKGFLRRWLTPETRRYNGSNDSQSHSPRERVKPQKTVLHSVQDIVLLQDQAFVLPIRGDIRIAHDAYEQAALTGAEVREVRMGEQYSFHFVYPRTPETGRKFNREA